ncbi:MAG: Gfo/Idh/MocA family oxidoreductase [Phycisphaerae bacterium]
MIKLAIVGTGSMANNHALAFKAIKGVNLVACCDIIADVAKQFAKTHNIRSYYADFDKMLDMENLDAVSIVSSDKFHAELSLAAIRKGLHLFCEKPLATNPEDAWKMAKVAQKTKVINMVNFVYRRFPALQKARSLVEKGTLGDIRHIEAHYLQSWLTGKHWGDWKKTPAFLWRLSKNYDSSGALGDIGCHILDFVTFVAGDISKIYCQIKTFDKGVKTPYKGYSLDANDSANILAEFVNGAAGTINVSRWATGQMDSLFLQVHGTKGALKIDSDTGEDKLWLSVGENINVPKWEAVVCGKCATNYERFIKSIKTGNNDVPDFSVGARIQDYINACFKSDAQKKPLSIK